jgi:hypothetical protein
MYRFERLRQSHEKARTKIRGRYPHMSDENQAGPRREAPLNAAMRDTAHDVRAEAVTAGMTEPDALEDFIVGALQLEWPWLSDDEARRFVRSLDTGSE